MKRVKIESLGPGFTIFGNRGNVWSNTAHAYKSGEGNLCGTPALSSNHAMLEGIKEVGCVECLSKLAANENDCSICGEEYLNEGNNAEPVNSGRCCDRCNLSVVLVARISML